MLYRTQHKLNAELLSSIFLVISYPLSVSWAFENVKYIMQYTFKGFLFDKLVLGLIIRMKRISHYWLSGVRFYTQVSGAILLPFSLKQGGDAGVASKEGMVALDFRLMALTVILSLLIIVFLFLLVYFNQYARFVSYAYFSIVVNLFVIVPLWLTGFKSPSSGSVDISWLKRLMGRQLVENYDAIVGVDFFSVSDVYFYAGIMAALPFFLFVMVLFLGSMERFLRTQSGYNFVIDQPPYIYILCLMALIRTGSAECLSLILEGVNETIVNSLINLQGRFVFGAVILYVILVNSITFGELLSKLRDSRSTKLSQLLSDTTEGIAMSSLMRRSYQYVWVSCLVLLCHFHGIGVLGTFVDVLVGIFIFIIMVAEFLITREFAGVYQFILNVAEMSQRMLPRGVRSTLPRARGFFNPPHLAAGSPVIPDRSVDVVRPATLPVSRPIIVSGPLDVERLRREESERLLKLDKPDIIAKLEDTRRQVAEADRKAAEAVSAAKDVKLQLKELQDKYEEGSKAEGERLQDQYERDWSVIWAKAVGGVVLTDEVVNDGKGRKALIDSAKTFSSMAIGFPSGISPEKILEEAAKNKPSSS